MIQDIGGTPATMIGGGGWGGSDGCGSWMGMLLVIALLGGGGLWGRREGHGDGWDGQIAHHDNTMNSQFNDVRNQERIDTVIRDQFGLQKDILENRFTSSIEAKDLQGRIDACCCNTQKGLIENKYELTLQNCGTNRNIDQTKYDLTLQNCNTNAHIDKCCCETNANITASTQKILDRLAYDEQRQAYAKINELERLNSEHRIIAAMKPVAPVPAYIQPSPYEQYYPRNFNGFNNCNPCGSGFNNGVV